MEAIAVEGDVPGFASSLVHLIGKEVALSLLQNTIIFLQAQSSSTPRENFHDGNHIDDDGSEKANGMLNHEALLSKEYPLFFSNTQQMMNNDLTLNLNT